MTIKGKKHYLCGICKQFTRYDLYNKKEGHCTKKCAPFLSQEALEQLPEKKEVEDMIMEHNVPGEEEVDMKHETEVATSIFGISSVAGFETLEGFLVLLRDIENGKIEDFLAI